MLGFGQKSAILNPVSEQVGEAQLSCCFYSHTWWNGVHHEINPVILEDIFLLPVPIRGFVITFLPEKVIFLRAIVQQYMFRSFRITNIDIANSIYSTIFGENYSKRIIEQQITPNKFKFLINAIWILGIFFLSVFFHYVIYYLWISYPELIVISGYEFGNLNVSIQLRFINHSQFMYTSDDWVIFLQSKILQQSSGQIHTARHV